MDKMLNWCRAHLPTRRRLIQLYAALLHNAHLRGFVTGEIFTGDSKALCMPGLNCYSCPGATGACPLGALQNALASSGVRTPAYVLGILLLLGLTFGRTICGFLCPMGLIQELLHKLPTPKLRKSRLTRALSWLKYALLGIFVILIPLWNAVKGYPLPAFCKYICPAGTLEGAVMLLAHPGNAGLFDMLGGLFTSKLVIMLAILLTCVFVFRAFCRFLCPLGAIYGLFAKLAVIGVKVDPGRCTDCGACITRCPMDIRRVGDHECIHCTACIGVCHTNAISLRAGRIVLADNESVSSPSPEAQRRSQRRRIAAWTAALLLLGGMLWYANRPGNPMPDPIPAIDESIPMGAEPGMRAPDFTVPLYGGGEWTLSEHRGQVIVLNFWATWCGPCVKELPHFEALAAAYPEEVAVVAVHSSLVTKDVDAWLARQAYGLPFALDDSGVIEAYGGSMMLPQTVVIGPDGIIVSNRIGSVTEEALMSLIEPVLP